MPSLSRLSFTAITLSLVIACGNSTSTTSTTTPNTNSSNSRDDNDENASGGRGDASSSQTKLTGGGASDSSRGTEPNAGGSPDKTNLGGSSAKDRSVAGGSSSKSQASAGGSSSKSQASAGGSSSKSQASAGGSSASVSSGTGGIKATATVPIGSSHTGEITFYDDVGDGTCMFGVTGEVDVAALAIGSWESATWCGACADVTGPKGTVRVRVVNQCPSCGGQWDLDLNKPTFLKIQEEKVGRFSVTWNFVACGITSPVSYRFKEGSSPGWVGVLVDNLNLPITKFEWSTDQTTWTEAQRQSYNYFESASGFGPNYVYVRITAVDGQVLNDRLPVARPALVVTGQANFE